MVMIWSNSFSLRIAVTLSLLMTSIPGHATISIAPPFDSPGSAGPAVGHTITLGGSGSVFELNAVINVDETSSKFSVGDRMPAKLDFSFKSSPAAPGLALTPASSLPQEVPTKGRPNPGEDNPAVNPASPVLLATAPGGSPDPDGSPNSGGSPDSGGSPISGGGPVPGIEPVISSPEDWVKGLPDIDDASGAPSPISYTSMITAVTPEPSTLALLALLALGLLRLGSRRGKGRSQVTTG